MKKGGRPSKRPTDDELNELYKTMSASEIAKKFGVSEHTVRGWIYKARRGK